MDDVKRAIMGDKAAHIDREAWTADSFVDLAGYAACGGEIAGGAE